MKAHPKCNKRQVILTLALSAVALTAVPYTVGAADAQKKLTTNPTALPTVQSPAKTQSAPAQTGNSTQGGRVPTAPTGTATSPVLNGMDRMRQANQMRDAQQQMRQLNDLRQGMQGANAMPGGQHRSGSGMPGVPGAGQPGGQLPGVSASSHENHGGQGRATKGNDLVGPGPGVAHIPGVLPRARRSPTRVGRPRAMTGRRTTMAVALPDAR